MSDSRKIIIVGPAHPLRGGIAAFTERLASQFIENKDNVIIYSFSLQYPSFLFPGKTQFSQEAPPGNLTIRTTINSINPISWIRTALSIRKEKPDAVIIKFWIPFMAPALGTIARLVKFKRKTKIIAIVHNMIPHEKRPGDALFAKYFCRTADGFLAMSKSVLTDITTFNNKKPGIFSPHPVYDHFGESISKTEARTLLKLPLKTKIILFFGFIREYKGLDILLKALCDSRLEDITLLVAGEFYMDSSSYFEFITANNLKNQVIFTTDFIPDSQVSKYFCAADVVVQPYKSATQSGVTQIAYHFNKPMIVSNVGGLPEIVPHGKVGFVVPPEPQQLANAIYSFYSLNKEKEFADNIRIEKQKFSWKYLTDNLNKLIS